jgi:hypothetical protein
MRPLTSAAIASAAAVLAILVLPLGRAVAWGPAVHRLVTNKAVDILPPEMAGFFTASRDELAQHSTDPVDARAKKPSERQNDFIYLDHYGRFPFDALPRDYKAAVKKFNQRIISANGVLPWQVGVYSEKLTIALRTHKWDEARQTAALLAYYAAETRDPFNTTEDFDGRKVGQAGIDQRFGTRLIERYLMFLFIHPSDSAYIKDSTDYAFEACLSAHSRIEEVLLADRRAGEGLIDYTDEYYDKFYNQVGDILVRQLSDAATDIGSYWLTAWINAGRPTLPNSR